MPVLVRPDQFGRLSPQQWRQLASSFAAAVKHVHFGYPATAQDSAGPWSLTLQDTSTWRFDNRPNQFYYCIGYFGVMQLNA